MLFGGEHCVFHAAGRNSSASSWFSFRAARRKLDAAVNLTSLAFTHKCFWTTAFCNSSRESLLRLRGSETPFSRHSTEATDGSQVAVGNKEAGSTSWPAATKKQKDVQIFT